MTKAPTAVTAETPVLLYWPEPPAPLYDRTRPRSNVQSVLDATHCAWMIGNVYISAVPFLRRKPEGIDFSLQKLRLPYHDYYDFGEYVTRIQLRRPVDTEAMKRQGLAILRSTVLYDLSSFNNATVAMLVLIAGLPDHHRRQFQQAWYKEGQDPQRYEWRWGRSPFKANSFAWPEDVAHFCFIYDSHDSIAMRAFGLTRRRNKNP